MTSNHKALATLLSDLGYTVDETSIKLVVEDAGENGVAPEHIETAIEMGIYSPCAVID